MNKKRMKMNIHRIVSYLINDVDLSKAKVAKLLEVDNKTVANILCDDNFKAVKIPVPKAMKEGI